MPQLLSFLLFLVTTTSITAPPYSVPHFSGIRRRPAFGSTAQKTLAVPRRSYSLSRRASRPGCAGQEDGAISTRDPINKSK